MIEWIKSWFKLPSPHNMTVEDYYRIEGIHHEFYENKNKEKT